MDLLAAYGLDSRVLAQLGDSEDARHLARVTEVQRSGPTVMTAAGERRVSIARELQRGPLLDRPTVGDWVLLDPQHTTVERLLERRSLFKRAAAGRGDEVQPIAANVDTLFIVSSCNDEFNEARLERYLTLCRESGAWPVLVLTKADLADDPDDFLARARAVQRDLAIEIVDARDGDALAGLRAWLRPRQTVALVGSSGVGKSTLLNALAGAAIAATQAIRETDAKGRHTTTHRALYRLPGGALVIDVPGMRELRVADVEAALDDVFDDIQALAARCRFGDCAHESEPGCAVKRAIEAGRLDERRLLSFRKLQRENDQATATIAERRAAERGFARVVDEAKNWKQRYEHGEE
jgi:ribosome biogenesis GTPase